MGARRSEFVDEQHPLLYKPLNLNDYAHAHMASIAQRKEVVPIHAYWLLWCLKLNVLSVQRNSSLAWFISNFNAVCGHLYSDLLSSNFKSVFQKLVGLPIRICEWIKLYVLGITHK